MAWGKTDEEKAQITAEKHAAQAAREQTKAEAAYWASPVGQAAQAKQRGDRFFQITIEASQLRGRSTDFLGPSSTSTTRRVQGVPDVLGQIEAVGWHLEHVGYVFVETGTNSRDKVLSSGAQTMTSGRVEGIYLFRAVDGPDDDLTVPGEALRARQGPGERDYTLYTQ